MAQGPGDDPATSSLGELPEDEQVAELGQPQEAPAPTGDAKIEPLGHDLASLDAEPAHAVQPARDRPRAW